MKTRYNDFSDEELSKLISEKQAYETVKGNEANIEKGKEEVLSDAGAGTV